MTVARAALWRELFASTILAIGGVPPGAPLVVPPPLPAHACALAVCTLTPPTGAEADAIAAEADRLLTRYAGDPTPLGRQCRALGTTMRAGAADVRMLPYMWRAPDPDGSDGDLAPVTGDAHPGEVAPGSGRVHIARGYDALNPDRGLPAIVETARHEFAHLTGLEQRAGWGGDAAAQLATACGPPDAAAAPPRGRPPDGTLGAHPLAQAPSNQS